GSTDTGTPADALLITVNGGARASLGGLLADTDSPPRIVVFATPGDPDLPGMALGLGAADAMAAPVHLPELCARIHARIRDRQAPRRSAYERESREALERLVSEARRTLLPDEVVLAMLRRLVRAFGLAGAAYLGAEPDGRGRVVAEVGRPSDADGLDLREWPEVLEALQTRRPTTMTQSGAGPTIVLPVGEPASHAVLLLRTEADRPLAPAQLALAGSLGEAAARAMVPSAHGEAAAGLERRLQEEYERARRYALTFSLVLVTVDALEESVRRLDEEAGGRLVAEMLGELRRVLRLPDFVSRYTTEGFAILLPETDVAGARRSLQRIRERLAMMPLEPEGRRAALSAGIVGFPHPAVTQADDMFALVEAALRRGRAQVGERVGVAE
ncbi:MAG TPA: GGDEF domain-containing protein, partial [Gemmatimonadales bacterium]|nr:GGDEF domain-containing protein [Gemmatimonadales bacterium]